jgi:peptidoglycan hydrolase-like protein with peptidoglycan-binding domain
MKMRHLVIATSAALLSSAAIAGGQQHSQSGENRSGQAQSQTMPQAGAEAATVRQAQERLQSAGYEPTPQGLREFQQAKGIAASGQLDQQTLAALGVGEPAASGASSENPKY